MTTHRIHHRTATVRGHEIHYREAGPAGAPVLLLLHGFPTSSHMFRDLMPLLADRYHLVAPDHLGFGRSSAPAATEFPYTFAGLAEITDEFTEQLGLKEYALYIQDYGAPIGLRLALAHPERVTAIITQNGNAYEDGLGAEAWAPVLALIAERTPATEEPVRALSGPEGIKWQYLHGVPDPTLVSPDAYEHDAALMARPGQSEIQLDLISDYGSNFALYPAFQEYFRTSQVPLLAVWGGHDEIFVPAGALAFQRDLPTAEIHLLPTGHFALETHAGQVAALMDDFLARRV
ncbi:alpha/beta hydrolase [Streptomyces avermitilis]|uniref:Hydrolase n=2 Tax=Streptomyces avermitilis TaxID=33903 RepID=Q82JN2_STRAW|nr:MULTISPECIES: alpha/beta hydrolase [Streptomyces]KUN51381.1 alpha/beta hydrolase [Streptomyces avermitilis]MYS98323.1 alpha/beta fold hydrolase [Streptomyces sp. SID5469]OOV33274.1 alpha/beta hydrolase [Streptomyces avermitilis]BAC70433.1 putative hydrolase [Streptomyces avermitilis MA-4680 = NBRC 14893]BBJ50534.1 hydrolase [Streptomyces avermitilis]